MVPIQRKRGSRSAERWLPASVRTIVDANVLAKPVTRTLLIAGAPKSGLRVIWRQMCAG